MERTVEVQVGESRALFRLLDDWAPRSVEAVWSTLPIETTIRHGKLSGEACFLELHDGPVLSLSGDPELPVTSIYKGYMVLVVHPQLGAGEILISYGAAEYRWPTGRRYVTPVGRLEGDGSQLLEELRTMFHEGEKQVRIRKVGVA